jgi:predicted AAA+ superfamily ATPase
VDPKFFTQTKPCLSEIDFLLQDGVNIIPCEVKSGENIKSASFQKYLGKYSPANAVLYSKLEYHMGNGFTAIPLYLAGKTKELM